MTLEEAKKVAGIIAEADGGCAVCVGRLVGLARRAFPEFRWSFKEYEVPVVDHEPTRVDGDGNRL